MLWSQTVDDYYPVSPRPRWGFGQPVHAVIREGLERSRPIYERSIDDLGRIGRRCTRSPSPIL